MILYDQWTVRRLEVIGALTSAGLVSTCVLVWPCMLLSSSWKELPWQGTGFPGGSDSKESACNARDPGSIPGSRRSPWRKEWKRTPVFLPGECRGQRSPVRYSPLGFKESVSSISIWNKHKWSRATQLAELEMREWKISRNPWVKSMHFIGCHWDFILGCCCSFDQSCLTLCNPMDCSTPDFPVLHYLSELAQTHVHWVQVMSSNHLVFCFPLLLLPSIFSSIRVFSNELALHIGGQSFWVSASASVLPMNIQGWFPLGLTGLISLWSKGLSRVFSNTAVQSIKSSVLSFLYSPALISIHDYWKNHSFD